MKNLYLRYWKRKGNIYFTTVHTSAQNARLFKNANEGKWKSHPHGGIIRHVVPDEVHARITRRLGKRRGIKAHISEIR